MTKISDVMTPNCQWISPETSLQEAAMKMRDMDYGFMPVGENDRMIGMITDRDIAIRAVADNMSPSMQVRDIMTPKTYYCYDDMDAAAVCNNMSEIKVRRLPVVNRDKRLVGIVSMGDLAQYVNNAETGETLKDITAQLRQHKQAA
ncbi:MAG: CBS domain-containing protein [Rhodospirillales bacterium]|nr:CBS domain-containing protein [Rhodospirillales bacterium]MCB9979581.1 CBS domain-containing protein [Rhodospirillales bacterium]